MLQSKFLVRENLRSEAREYLLRSVQRRHVVEMNLFAVVALDESDLHDPGKVGVQFVEHGVDLFGREFRVLVACDLVKVLNEALSRAEVAQFRLVELVPLQEGHVKAISADEVGKLLDRCLRPSLDSTQELPRVLLLELINRLLELNLSGA